MGFDFNLYIRYNHYLYDGVISEGCKDLEFFKNRYPLDFCSRKFDKPALKIRDECYFWYVDNKRHRLLGPSEIWYCW